MSKTKGLERRRLALLVLSAFLVRLAVQLREQSRPGFVWLDPDGYMRIGRTLAEGGWHWSLDAVLYLRHVKAPLYQILLSLFALDPDWYPASAAVVQAFLGAAAVAWMFVLGRAVHSSRAGWIAAASYALYLPAVYDCGIFLQESAYIPLLIGAFAVLADAMERDGAPRRFALAGAVFGVAALVRSMPVYFLPPAMALYLLSERGQAVARRRALALVLGFLALTLPYSVYISMQMGHLILIDNMGSIHFATVYHDSRAVVHAAPPPSLPEAVLMVLKTFTTHPLDFLGERFADARTLFLLRGGRFLEDHAWAETAAGAWGWKMATHALQDLNYGLAAILAPLGWVLARGRRAATLLGLWVALNVALLAALTWSGARYRAPFEPQLMVFAAVVAAGGWRALRPAARLGAAACSVALAAALLPSLPVSLGSRATYGVTEWLFDVDGQRTRVKGAAGFTAWPVDGAVRLVLSGFHAERPLRVRVRANGQDLSDVRIEGRQQVPLTLPTERRLYVELDGMYEDRPGAGVYRVRIVVPQLPSPQTPAADHARRLRQTRIDLPSLSTRPSWAVNSLGVPLACRYEIEQGNQFCPTGSLANAPRGVFR